MRLGYGVRLPNLGGAQRNIDCQVCLWLEPEICLASGVRDVHVNSCLLAPEEEPELAVADDGGCNVATVAQGACPAG
jgi:hypothetical protein